MYLGFYPSTCSVKNQLTFPSKFKELTGVKLMVGNWFEKSLIVLPFTQGEEVLDKVLGETSSLLPEARDLERFFYASAVEVVLDDKNRFVLPKQLREYARIGEEAVFIGIKDRIELWDKEIYKNYGKIREAQIRETAITHYNRIVIKRNNQ